LGKIKLTKGELKQQRDELKQYERYLPTLQLKKQQLQIEILQQASFLAEYDQQEQRRRQAIKSWVGLLADSGINLQPWVTLDKITTSKKNVAGVDIPIFEDAEFKDAEYDLFSTPLWVDFAIEALRNLVVVLAQMRVVEEGIKILKQELRIATQRVNLFEKVKIPDARQAIRLIKIYIGDQMANAVGRSKIAKRKIEEAVLDGVMP